MSQVKENAENIKTCFVVTPIGGPDSDIRRHADGLIKMAIKPALGEEYDVKAAHDYFDSMSITKQVYEKLYESDLVIANLTGLNPNVMYELGIRFCFGKPVILIAKEGEQLPFDITEYRTYFYKDDFLGLSELKDILGNVITTINYNDKSESPIHNALKQVEIFKQLHKNSEKDEVLEILSLILKKLDNKGVSSKNYDEIQMDNMGFVEDFMRHYYDIKIQLDVHKNKKIDGKEANRINRDFVHLKRILENIQLIAPMKLYLDLKRDYDILFKSFNLMVE